MIDIHTHILPGMDDGSKSPEETVRLLELLHAQGVTTVVATPHFYPSQETPADFLARREAACKKLSEDVTGSLLLGAEVAYFPGLCGCEDLIPLQIGNTGLLLVEMPFRAWNDRMIEDICSIPSHLGLTPVLAHVNRYRGGSQFPKYRDLLLDNDVLFQCNAEAFEPGLRGRWALQMVKKGYIHFLGSDCHNLTTRPPKLGTATEILSKKLGHSVLRQLNAQARSWLEP